MLHTKTSLSHLTLKLVSFFQIFINAVFFFMKPQIKHGLKSLPYFTSFSLVRDFGKFTLQMFLIRLKRHGCRVASMVFHWLQDEDNFKKHCIHFWVHNYNFVSQQLNFEGHFLLQRHNLIKKG